ncbi:MAG: hypothetical protein ACQEWM_07335 [Actinomycetota bacterium]
MDGTGADDPRAWKVARGEVVAMRGRARTWIGVLLGGVAFTVAGAAMVVGPLSDLPFGSSRFDTPFTVLVGAVGVLLFGGVFGTTAIRNLVRLPRALVLEPDGLRNHGGELVPWHEVRDVTLRATGGREHVLLQLGDAGTRAWLTGVAPAARWIARRERAGMPVPPLDDRDLYGLWVLLHHLRASSSRRSG